MSVVYVSKQAVTLATRARAYEKLSDFCLHAHALDLNLVSIIRRADNFIEVTVNKAIRDDQLDHLGLELAP